MDDIRGRIKSIVCISEDSQEWFGFYYLRDPYVNPQATGI